MLFPSLNNRGGFFSDYYLGTVFGRGTGRRKSLVTKEMETAFRILQRLHERAEQKAGDVPALREAYARPLLRDVFGYHLAEGEKQIHPLFTSAEDEAQGRPPLLLAYVGDFAEDLDAKRDGKIPATQRLGAELAGANADFRYGLLLTGERVRLIRRKGDGPAGAYLELDLPACLESEDRDSFAAAHRLFRAEEFQPAEDGTLPIDAVERESREHAEKVSEDLKRAVFGSAETLVQALLDARAGDGNPEAEHELTVLRDAALTCLYRLLFILYAEARDERLKSHAVYGHSYSLDRLAHELMTLPDPPSANRTGLWERVLALFALHRDGLPGVEGLDPLPARGGALFDPASPDGRILQEVRLDDATVARLVLDLTTTSPRRGVGKERISFRELGIEQLGSVYEGLLEFEPRVADGTEIEVKVQGRTYALPPSELVRLVREKNLKLKGTAEIVAGTEAEPLHPDLAPDESEAEDDLSAVEPEEAGTGDDEGAGEGVKKGAPAILIRRLEPGRFHFVPGPGRKGSGTFYTPLPLVQDLARHALGPLVEGRTPSEIESLRVLDPACGSAHFLVEAMRFLGRALHRAYVEELSGTAPPDFRGTWEWDWNASDQDARASGSEARAWCKRRIAERCLFGVDLNPTAVQLAQVSLWIESLAGDRPLTYFTHHVRCGNSILGTWLKRLGEPPLPELRARQVRDGGMMQDIFTTQVREAVEKAADVRRQIDEADAAIIAVGADADPLAEQKFKEGRRKEAEDILAAARLLFDLRSASAFLPAIWEAWPNLCDRVGDQEELDRYAHSRPWWDAFEQVRGMERFLHWELEFPEVFLGVERPGFDAVLGNPPWDKVKPDRKEFYGRYDVLIRAFVGGELDARIRELQTRTPELRQKFEAYEGRVKTVAACMRRGTDYQFQAHTGGAFAIDLDIFSFFVERAHQLSRLGGCVGFVVPGAIYNNQGCTGLRNLLFTQTQVERFYAFENRDRIFPIHPSYRFVSLVFQKGPPERDTFEAAFMRHDLSELAEEQPRSWMVPVRRAEVEVVSPENLVLLEYRSPRDREVLLSMHGIGDSGGVTDARTRLGEIGEGENWGAEFHRELHLTDDRDLWSDSSGKLLSPRSVLGSVPSTTQDPPFYKLDAWPETRRLMRDKGFWPLYQDAHIHQHILHFKPMMRWVSLEAHERKYRRLPDSDRKLVIRDRGRNTDERMCIAAVLPPESCFGHSLTRIDVQSDWADLVCTLVNSLSFDYLARQRNSGQHVSAHVLRPCVVPTPLSIANLEPVSDVSAPQRETWIYDDSRHWEALASAEFSLARAYGLDASDYQHVVSSFPIFARKRPGFFAYLSERIRGSAAEPTTRP